MTIKVDEGEDEVVAVEGGRKPVECTVLVADSRRLSGLFRYGGGALFGWEMTQSTNQEGKRFFLSVLGLILVRVSSEFEPDLMWSLASVYSGCVKSEVGRQTAKAS